MKRRLSVLLIIALLAASLAGCGGSSGGAKEDSYAPGEGEYSYSDNSYGSYSAGSYSETDTNGQSGIPDIKDPRKIIYRATVSIDTVDFDESVEALNASVKEFGGYIEESYLSGNSYYSSGSRSLSVTVRIPAENYEAFLLKRTELGSTVYFSESTEDVTSEYIDISARIETLEAQEDRLLALIDSAKDLEEMLLLEDKLTDVRYQIESAQARLNVYDDLISYCTVTININEVEKVSNVNTGFGHKVAGAFVSSWVGFVNVIQEIIIALVSVLPLLIIIAVAAFFIIRSVRKKDRRNLERFAAARAEKEAEDATAEKQE